MSFQTAPTASQSQEEDAESLVLRRHGPGSSAPLIYLPGMHGDWTLASSFRSGYSRESDFVDMKYPRTLSWSLDEHAGHILDALQGMGINESSLLAESFGSQIAWRLLVAARERGFKVQRLVLAGGFVRYPAPPLVRVTESVSARTPMSLLVVFLRGYARFARWRHRHAPETLASIREFVERRTEADRRAMVHRLRLIREADPGAVARAAELPVYHLTGFWDPIVFWPAVKRWLRRNCPGYRATRVFKKADHNVLGTDPEGAVAQVRAWLNE